MKPPPWIEGVTCVGEGVNRILVKAEEFLRIHKFAGPVGNGDGLARCRGEMSGVKGSALTCGSTRRRADAVIGAAHRERGIAPVQHPADGNAFLVIRLNPVGKTIVVRVIQPHFQPGDNASGTGQGSRLIAGGGLFRLETTLPRARDGIALQPRNLVDQITTGAGLGEVFRRGGHGHAIDEKPPRPDHLLDALCRITAAKQAIIPRIRYAAALIAHVQHNGAHHALGRVIGRRAGHGRWRAGGRTAQQTKRDSQAGRKIHGKDLKFEN